MDVDPSPISSKTTLEAIPESASVVCLPYITSNSYQKAVNILGKQQNTLVVTTEHVSPISTLDRGMTFLIYFPFFIFSNPFDRCHR